MDIQTLALFNGSILSSRPSGIGVVARDLAAALSPPLIPLLDPLGNQRPGSIAIPNNLAPDSGPRGHLRRLLWTQQTLPELVRASGASLLLSPLPEAPLLRGIRSVVLAHDLLPLRHPQFTPLLAYHLAYVPLVLHQAERVLCNSEATKREIHNRLGVPLRKLITIRLGFDPKQLRPLDLPRQPFLLVLGRHDPHKNIARVLQAFSRLDNRDIQLKLVGTPDRRYTPGLKQLAEELGIGKRCHWIPWVSDAERLELLNTTQALVMASLWEGFGLPALEALACGTAVISSTTGALPEVVGDVAILVDPRNTAAIADAMAEAINNPNIPSLARTYGPLRAAKFQWKDTARQIETLLKEIA